MTADLGHLAGRIPDGQGHPAEADRRHAAGVAEQHLQLAAGLYVDLLARGDEGGAARHLQRLRLAAELDPWRLCEAVATRALRTSFGGSPFDG